MPRYFTHLRDKELLLEDIVGQEFLSLADAREEAILAARELMAAGVIAGKRPSNNKFEITDDAGRTVLVVPFEHAFNE